MRAAVCVALVVAVAAVYGQVGGFGFVNFDDWHDVRNHPHVQQGLSWEGVRDAFSQPFWFPLTFVSFQLDASLLGNAPGGFHLVNVAWHALAAVLLFLALARMTGAPGCSAFVAAVFALHPLQAESVAWISERKNVLAGALWMATLYAYAAYVERPRVASYLLVFLGLLAGLFAKPILVTLPFALLLLDHWPLARLGRLGRRAVVEKLPLFALVAVFSVGTFLAQRESGFTADAQRFPLDLRLMNAVDSYVRYLGAALWPSGLAVFYPHPLETLSGLRVAAGASLLVGVTAAAWRRPYLLVGWLWFLGTLVPMIGLVQVWSQARADRYMYVSLVGLAVMAAWGGAELARGSPERRRALGAVAGAALVAAAAVSFVQVRTWSDTITLFQRAVDVTERNAVAEHRLAAALLRDGQVARAAEHYRRLFALGPPPALAYNDYAWILATAHDASLRDPGEAVRLAEALVQGTREPGPQMLDTLATCYAAAGRFAEAVRVEERAVALARADGRAGAVRQFEARLALFRAGRPYVERQP